MNKHPVTLLSLAGSMASQHGSYAVLTVVMCNMWVLGGAGATENYQFGSELNGGITENLTSPPEAAPGKPHILFVLWDDFGWTGVYCGRVVDFRS